MENRAELISLLDACRSRGARAAEVLLQRFERLETTGARVRPQRVSEVRYTVRAWLEGGHAGVGIAPTGRAAVELAIAACASAPPSEFAGPADKVPPVSGSLGVDDRRYGQVEEADRNELLQSAERALGQGVLQLRRLRYTEGREKRSWMSSRDGELNSANTTYALSATAASGDLEIQGRIASRHFADVASLPFGTDLRRRIEGLVRPATLPTASLPVVLDPRGVAAFVRSFAPAFAADRVAAGNFITARRGRVFGNTLVHITDDAGLASGLLSLPFDDRGVSPIAVPLLKEGVVNSLYHSPETARAAGLRPTGHVRNGAIQPTNLIVRPGSRTRNVILTSMSDYLVLDEVPPVDLATGQVTGPVRVGVVSGGERIGAASCHLDLPLADLLQRVEELAADQERSEEVDAPTFVFGSLPFTR